MAVATEREVLEAVDDGDPERLHELLREDPALAGSRGADGISLVMKAQYAMRDDLVRAVLAAGPELDAHEAAAVGDVSRLRTLTDAEPQLVRELAGDGFATLHLAAFFRRPQAVRLLLDRGADPNVRAANDSAVAPLHSATAGGDRESVRLLLDAGSDPNARQRGGFTPLHAAAAAGDRELVELLLGKGADSGAATDDGRTARDLAAERGHDELTDLLTSPGGPPQAGRGGELRGSGAQPRSAGT